MTIPAYDPQNVDQDAATQPGCRPLELYGSGVRHAIPANDSAPLVTWREVKTVLLVVVAAAGALLVGFHAAYYWALGGWLGLAMSVGQSAAGVGLGASVVAVLGRRNG